VSQSSDDMPSGERPTVQRRQPFMPPGQQGFTPTPAPGPQAAPPGPPPGSLAASAAASDRLAVHLIWEGVLLVIGGVLVGLALASTPEAHLADVVRPAGYIGLVAAGLALSLRTGTPNLRRRGIASDLLAGR
jgi:hypothetical protein